MSARAMACGRVRAWTRSVRNVCSGVGENAPAELYWNLFMEHGGSFHSVPALQNCMGCRLRKGGCELLMDLETIGIRLRIGSVENAQRRASFVHVTAGHITRCKIVKRTLILVQVGACPRNQMSSLAIERVKDMNLVRIVVSQKHS